jgi:hypothetical protein
MLLGEQRQRGQSEGLANERAHRKALFFSAKAGDEQAVRALLASSAVLTVPTCTPHLLMHCHNTAAKRAGVAP